MVINAQYFELSLPTDPDLMFPIHSHSPLPIWNWLLWADFRAAKGQSTHLEHGYPQARAHFDYQRLQPILSVRTKH
jgi:hypothetical protein